MSITGTFARTVPLLLAATFGAATFGAATFGAATFGAATFGAATFGAATLGSSRIREPVRPGPDPLVPAPPA